MQYISLRGIRPSRLFFRLAALSCLAYSIPAYSQSSVTCTPSATPLVVHAEGVAEPSGLVALNCTGTAGASVTANLTLFYSVPVTNRLLVNPQNPNGYPDAVLTVNAGSVVVPTPVLVSPSALAFNGVSFTVPASGMVSMNLSNVRLNASVGKGQPISAQFSTSAISLTSSEVIVATPQTGLLATYSSAGITCVGSLLPPAPITFATLLAQGTTFASTRVTEGFGNAFSTKDPSSDAGTRILLRFANFPAGATVYLPDSVAGSDVAPSSATRLTPTAAGDLGVPVLSGVSPGAYTPGSLLLERVSGADSTGAGGTPIASPANAVFGSVSPVPLSNGAGTAVYEVIDANPNVLENAQIPVFVGNSPSPNQIPVVATEQVSLAAYNTTPTAAVGAPVPRFAAPTPPSDCTAVGDCAAEYFPVLSATTSGLQFSVSPGGNVLSQFILVNNTGGGNMVFTPTVSYQTGSGWLTITNEGGNTNHTTLGVAASPAGLAQGIYQATVTIDAGAAGKQSFPATFNIGPPQITISKVVNAASFQPGPLVAGSLATIQGTNFAGKATTVTFNGLAGTVVFSNAQQINVQVPSSLASATSAQVVVTVDGNSSPATTVQLANINPGIFGVLNQDNTVNTPVNPAQSGSVIQIFATGLISPVSSGQVTTGLGNQGIATLYSGASPNGLQQVNAQLPTNAASLPGILVVCGTGAGGNLVCSPAFTIYTK
jgi:uncharacterized protein (TIGR03437 family)